MMRSDRDQLIRRALTPPTDVVAPADLGEEIYRAVTSTPQARRAPLSGLAWGPLYQGTWVLLVVALLLAGLAISILGRPQPAPPIRVQGYHGGPERTGVMAGPGPMGEVGIGWQVQRRGPVPFTLMPIASDDVIYVADAAGDVSALAAIDGTTRWTTRLETPVTGSPILEAGLLVVGTESGEIIALGEVSGRERWRHDVGSAVHASLVAVEGLIIVAAEDGSVAALDAATGEVRWTMMLPGIPARGPAIADGTMYIGASEQLLAIDLATRAERWRFEIGPGTISTPTATEGVVYVSGGVDAETEHAVIAIDAASGLERWRFETEDGGRVLVGAVADGSVYALGDDGFVYNLAAADGQLLWRFETGGPIAALASVAQGVVYVASTDRSVYAIEALMGSERWRVDVSGEPTLPLVIGGRVVVGTNVGTVLALVGSNPSP